MRVWIDHSCWPWDVQSPVKATYLTGWGHFWRGYTSKSPCGHFLDGRNLMTAVSLYRRREMDSRALSSRYAGRGPYYSREREKACRLQHERRGSTVTKYALCPPRYHLDNKQLSAVAMTNSTILTPSYI